AEPIEASYHMVAIKGRRHDRTRAAQASRDDHACRAGTVQTWSNNSVRVTERNVSASTVELAAAPLSVQVTKRRIL
ncbi:hypothetical protein, partial [Falsiroseomonas oryzae]|uniref:hypothetical protein n=1 Tax=Falsiroseomonas oryzae TaxID=2766473 RepID=UPI0022EA64CC